MRGIHQCLTLAAIALTASLSATAGVTVGANMLSVVGKQSNGVAIAFPDVCKTPSPAGPIPIPYPNVAHSSDPTKGTKKVKASPKQPVAGSKQEPTTSDRLQSINPVLHTLDEKLGGKVLIRSVPVGDKFNVSEAAFVDASGRKVAIQEPALIELANGEYCAVCAAQGEVTAIYRFVSVAPAQKKIITPKERLSDRPGTR